jgi:hypothetical protein
MFLRFTDLYAKEIEMETINFGCNNTEAASKLNTVLNTIGPNFDLFTPLRKWDAFHTSKVRIWTFHFSHFMPY